MAFLERQNYGDKKKISDAKIRKKGREKRAE